MVKEVNQAVLWMKENGPRYGVNSERIILMGGSAGAHLALMAAYTPGHSEFKPFEDSGDTAVHGVVVFYPPVDFLQEEMFQRKQSTSQPNFINRAAQSFLDFIFTTSETKRVGELEGVEKGDNMIVQMLGGRPEEIPDTYRLLSPLYHINKDCPPTLILQGSEDVFGLSPAVRRFHLKLMAANVPVIYVEFPHTEHGFDLIFPQISPPAQAAIYNVEIFLECIK
jgi:acetyl esterase/lipase